MVARHFLGHKACDKQSVEKLKKLLQVKNQPWENCPEGFKNGRVIIKEEFVMPEQIKQTPKGEILIPQHTRTRWVSKPAFDFKDVEKLKQFIPSLPVI
jgi:hypothetical protein